eukprot:scaffold464_cov244-Pinguiococcus_pyrenoidosus.AAC.8
MDERVATEAQQDALKKIREHEVAVVVRAKLGVYPKQFVGDAELLFPANPQRRVVVQLFLRQVRRHASTSEGTRCRGEARRDGRPSLVLPLHREGDDLLQLRTVSRAALEAQAGSRASRCAVGQVVQAALPEVRRQLVEAPAQLSQARRADLEADDGPGEGAHRPRQVVGVVEETHCLAAAFLDEGLRHAGPGVALVVHQILGHRHAKQGLLLLLRDGHELLAHGGFPGSPRGQNGVDGLLVARQERVQLRRGRRCFLRALLPTAFSPTGLASASLALVEVRLGIHVAQIGHVPQRGLGDAIEQPRLGAFLGRQCRAASAQGKEGEAREEQLETCAPVLQKVLQGHFEAFHLLLCRRIGRVVDPVLQRAPCQLHLLAADV